MSKIQKALGRLRSDAPAAGETGESSAAVAARSAAVSGGSVRERRRQPERSRRHGPDDTGEPERRPRQSVSINPSALGFPGFGGDESERQLLAQQFRRIKRPVLNIGFGQISYGVDNANVVMMASALPRSGKTFCSVNLAASIARERDVGAVIVDADVLKPNISRSFGLEERSGLIDFLQDPDVVVDDILLSTDFHDIIIVPAGRLHPEATELLASRRMERLVTELSVRFRSRAIIVDTPPLLLTNEAHVLTEHAGQIILVVEAGQSTQASVMQALESLNREKPINVIMNKARGSGLVSTGEYGYGGDYYSYYGYGG